MKILFTESQIFKLLKEQYDERKYGDYVNRILDKINASGLDSLSDEEHEDLKRLSQGEDIHPDEEPKEPEYQEDFSSEEDGDMLDDTMDDEPFNNPPVGEEYNMFMGMLPPESVIKIDGLEWIVSKKEISQGLTIINISNEGVDIKVGPFIDGDKFVVKGPSNEQIFKVDHVPQNTEEMEKFYDTFMDRDLLTIVKRMIKKQ